MDIKIRSHCNGKLTQVFIGNGELWFSYETLVAYRTDYHSELTISENVWSQTTGKHLNYINPDKSIRIAHETFLDKIAGLTLIFDTVPHSQFLSHKNF